MFCACYNSRHTKINTSAMRLTSRGMSSHLRMGTVMDSSTLGNLKRCSVCRMDKPLSEYHKDNTIPSGYRTACKDCRRIQCGWNKRVEHPEGMKICSTCHSIKPASLEYFGVSKKGAFGLSGKCKSCAIEYETAYNRKKGIAPKQYLTVDSSGNLECSKCHSLKPATQDYFSRNAKSRLGIGSICKACTNLKLQSKRIADGSTPRETKRRIKTKDNLLQCTSCKLWLPPTNDFFYTSKRLRFGLYRTCKECTALRASEYRKTHLETIKRSKDRSREKNRENIRESSRKSRRLHSDTSKTAYHRYVTRKRGLPCAFTTSDWRESLKYFGNCCAVCNRPRGLWHTLAMDHWIPLTSPDCPGTVPSNIIPLCHGVKGCNNQKNNRSAAEWLTAKFGPRRANKILSRINAYFDSLRITDE